MLHIHIVSLCSSDRVAPGQYVRTGPTGMTAIPMKILRSLKKVFMRDPTDSRGNVYHYPVTRGVGRGSELGGGHAIYQATFVQTKITLQLSASKKL